MGSSRPTSKTPRARSAGGRPVPDGSTATSPPFLATAYLIGLAAAVVICFWPLTTYFFAQDDFLLIGKAAFYPVDSITDYFARGPGHFRPLSKGLYFVVAHRVFGMNATPYHLVALLLHIFNVVMTYRLLRRLGTGELAGLAAVTLFALSTGYFHVLAWISCVQQLMALAFVLVSFEFGMRTIDGGRPRDRWISLVAYAGALGSAEQALLAPALVVLYAVTRPGGRRRSLRDGVNATVEQWGLLAAFAVFVLVWRTIPDQGTYAFRVGSNVVVNLLAYIGWSFHYAIILPREMTLGGPVFYKAHLFFLGLVTYQLYRRRGRELGFGIGCFLLLMLPTLFLTRHQFYLHTYIPSLGMIYLVALVADDVFRLPRLARSELRFTILGLALIAMAALSYHYVRANELARLTDETKYRRSFVIRRAMAARNVWDSVSRRMDREADAVVMVYGRSSGLDLAGWNNVNVVEAIGKGALLALLYNRPALPVHFIPESSLPTVDRSRADVFFYDDFGNCYTVGEMTGDG